MYGARNICYLETQTRDFETPAFWGRLEGSHKHQYVIITVITCFNDCAKFFPKKGMLNALCSGAQESQ